MPFGTPGACGTQYPVPLLNTLYHKFASDLLPQWIFFSRITAFSQRSIRKSITAAAMASPKFMRKNQLFSSKPSQRPLSMPLSLLPTEVLRKKPPIIKAVIRGGLNLLTSDRPMGLKQSSPTVITP